jgi:hypothetical protein
MRIITATSNDTEEIAAIMCKILDRAGLDDT